MPHTFRNARQLVDEFKKSGEFDRLRRQLLTHFTNSDELKPLMSRVEEIAREKLSTDVRLEHKRGEQVYSEVMQELERYPMIERAMSDLDVLKDQSLVTSIEQYVQNILSGKGNEFTKVWNARIPRCKANDDNLDDSADEDISDNVFPKLAKDKDKSKYADVQLSDHVTEQKDKGYTQAIET